MLFRLPTLSFGIEKLTCDQTPEVEPFQVKIFKFYRLDVLATALIGVVEFWDEKLI